MCLLYILHKICYIIIYIQALLMQLWNHTMSMNLRITAIFLSCQHLLSLDKNHCYPYFCCSTRLFSLWYYSIPLDKDNHVPYWANPHNSESAPLFKIFEPLSSFNIECQICIWNPIWHQMNFDAKVTYSKVTGMMMWTSFCSIISLKNKHL